jgi:hypothetical protein
MMKPIRIVIAFAVVAMLSGAPPPARPPPRPHPGRPAHQTHKNHI